jgi:RecA/RadA recombinase
MNVTRLGKLKQHLKEKSGDETIRIGSQLVERKRIRTGVFTYDLALGGGYPIGLCAMNAGWEGAGKTTMFMKAIGDAQKRCANCWRYAKDLEVEEQGSGSEVEYVQTGKCDCFITGELPEVSIKKNETKDEFVARIERYKTNSYEQVICAMIDLEQTFDAHWASKHCDPRLLLLLQLGAADEVSDVYIDLMATGEVHVIMLDSVALITGAEEVEESQAKYQQGLQARHVGKMIRRILSQQANTRRDYHVDVTHFWVNQYIEKIGVMFGKSTTYPGGNRQRFFYSVITEWFQSKKEKETVKIDGLKNDDQDEVMIAKRLNYEVVKNKTSPDGRKGSFRFVVRDHGGKKAGSVDDLDFIVDLLCVRGYMTKESPQKWVLLGEPFQSRTAAVKYIRDTQGVRQRLEEMLMDNLIENQE